MHILSGIDMHTNTVLHFLCSSAQLNKFSVVCARQILLANGNATSCADKNGRKPMHNLCAKMDGSRVGMEFAQVPQMVYMLEDVTLSCFGSQSCSPP